MINIAAIASGSNGNCYYIEDENDSFIVDAGISCKQIINRMKNLNLNIKKLKGIFITHEHSDHIRGVEVLSKMLDIPVFITKLTHEASRLKLRDELIRYIELNKIINIGEFKINPFSKIHDAAEPCSYTFEKNSKKITVLTDIGKKCENSINAIKGSDAIFLESNYDLTMLQNGKYPPHIKQRISSGMGHLSNNEASAMLVSHATSNLKHVILSHISLNNNCPTIAEKVFLQMVNLRSDLNIKSIIANRNKETELISLN